VTLVALAKKECPFIAPVARVLEAVSAARSPGPYRRSGEATNRLGGEHHPAVLDHLEVDGRIHIGMQPTIRIISRELGASSSNTLSLSVALEDAHRIIIVTYLVCGFS
jgi:hypothetical protein